MKKFICLVVLIMSILVTGCANDTIENSSDRQNADINSNINDNKTTNTEEKSKEIEIDTKNIYKDIDVLSMKKAMEPIFLEMYNDKVSYKDCQSGEYLYKIVYSIINTYFTDEKDSVTELNYDATGFYIAMDLNKVSEYLKAGFNSYGGDLVENYTSSENMIMQYLPGYNAYGIVPADGGPIASIKVLNAHKNGDNTYEATVGVTIEDDTKSQNIGRYVVSMVKNDDSSSKFQYRIRDIEKDV